MDLLRFALVAVIGGALFFGSTVSKWGDAWLDGVGMGAAAAIVCCGAVSVVMGRLKPEP